jgi:hypothetical protein
MLLVQVELEYLDLVSLELLVQQALEMVEQVVSGEAGAVEPLAVETVEQEEVGQYFCTGNYVCNSNCS